MEGMLRGRYKRSNVKIVDYEERKDTADGEMRRKVS